MTPDGKCHLIAVGPCNHAGDGFYPGLGSNNGNRRLIAFECCWPTPRPDLPLGYDPHEQWSTPLIITMRDATAAVLKKLGVGSARAIGHKEYAPNRKIDPGNMDMNWFRGEVQKDLDGVIFPGEGAVPQLGPIPRQLAAAPAARGSAEPQPVRELCDLLPGSGGQVMPEVTDRTVADQLAEIQRLATELRGQLDELRALQLAAAPNGQSGDGAPKNAAAPKKVAVKKVPGNGAAAKKSPAKEVAAKLS